ncbi:MAG TPA: sugar ABC transporter permease [Chloroflexota bacterium]|nr:sugar ABC transporter permease [Chloroflexota bacterium]
MAIEAARRRGSPQARRNLRAALVFLSPWIVGMLGLWLIPTALSLYFAFTDYTGAVWPPHWIGFGNFQAMFDGTDPDFMTTLGVTAWWVFLSVPSALIAGLLLALLLNWNVRGIAIYRTIFFLPSLVPFVGSALLFVWLLNPQSGLVNVVLGWLHLPQPGWFSDPAWSRPGLLIQNVWAAGATIIIFLAGLQDVPEELYEAASLDGATRFARFWHVTLPLITPTVFFNLILGMINSFQYFAQAFVVSTVSTAQSSSGAAGEVGGPAGSTLFFSLHIYDQAFQQGNVGYASALAWVLVIVVVAITLVLVRTSGRWVHYGG